jgi:hypothetical protein
MLESISWQEFLTTIALILGGYYAITTLLLYSREITNIFKSGQSNTSTDTKTDQTDSGESHDLMGGVRFEHSRQQDVPREETTEADALHVAPPHDVEEPVSVIDLQEEALRNDLVSIQAEVKSLAEIISLGTKEEVISLFKTLLSNYPQFIGTSFQPQISQFIYDSCIETTTHQFDPQKINSWWTDPETDSNSHQ